MYAPTAPDDFRLRSVSEVNGPAQTTGDGNDDTGVSRPPRATEAEHIVLELRGDSRLSVHGRSSFYV